MAQEKRKGKGKRPVWLGVIGVLTAGVVLAATSGMNREGVQIRSYPQLAPETYCTVLVYMDGSDLERDYGAAAEDLREMEEAIRDAGMDSETLNVVVEAGGAGEWQYDAMRGTEYGRFCLSEKGVKDKEELEVRNMSRADTLADFINYGIQSYPAEHYGLVLWNHGAGQIEGFGSDDNFDSASMSLESIKEALEASDRKESFDFISLDACLMGNLEIVSVLEGKADYIIASEELEPQNGYDYAWLEVIGREEREQSPRIGRAVGEAMLASYEASYAENDYKVTLSLIDVGAYQDFHDVFHQMVETASGHAGEELYQGLGKLRRELQGFGNRQDNMTAEIVDVMDLLEAMAELEGDQTALEQIRHQIKKLVPKKVTKGYREEPSGLSIYLPSGANDWLQDDMEIYNNLSFCKSYQKLLDGYRDYLVKENHMEWRTPSRDRDGIRMKVDTEWIEEISGAYLTVFYDAGGGLPCLLSTDSDVRLDRGGFLKATPQDTYWGLKGQVLCLIETLNTEQYTEYLAPILYNDELCTLFIGFDEDNPGGVIQSVTPVGVRKKEYELKEGDTIVPLYPLADPVESGEHVYDNSYYMGEKFSIESLENGDAMLEQISVDRRTCSFGFMIQDTKQKLYYTDTAE